MRIRSRLPRYARNVINIVVSGGAFFYPPIATHHIINYFCTYYVNNIMKHHPKEEKDLNYIYYLVGILSGAFVGAVINVAFVWILVGAILGFLTAAFFVNVLAKSSEEA
jgi:hypothetical protein